MVLFIADEIGKINASLPRPIRIFVPRFSPFPILSFPPLSLSQPLSRLSV